MNFKDLALSDEIKRAVAEQDFTEATQIQEQSIPYILEGKDVIGYSQTGSGKTAAFGLPAIQSINTEINAKYPQVLILCPTRELALQAAGELRKFSKYIERVHIVAIYGGDSISRQVAAIRSGCQIIVGTPGRVMDHMRRKTLDLSRLKMVVLDEADEMLNMGFREDIETILSETPEERQTILFSATMPKEILEITGKFQRNPQMVKIKSSQKTAVNIEQSYFEVARGRKNDALSLLLQYYQPRLSLVFCNTKKMVDEVTADLKTRGYSAESLHGDMKQSQRTQVMNRFKNGGFDILVATDVASRGIDVNNIDIVFNYDLPDDNEYYIHRIGRTARAGKSGKSFTLIQNSAQYTALRKIAGYTHSDIAKMPLPTVAEIESKNSQMFVDEVLEYANNNDFSSRSVELDKLIENGLTERDVALALINKHLNERSLKKGTVDVPVESFKELKRASFEGSKGREKKRRPRVPNEKAAKKFENIDMESIRISIGRRDKIAPKHILGAVAGESGLPGSIMGTIDIHHDYTVIDVPKKFRTRIVKAIKNKTINGKRVTAE